jgi:hypothetical protein
VSGHNFGNKNYASSILDAFSATNVEAQVYLIEIRVKRNGATAEYLGATELKTHQAEVGSSLQ